MNVLQGETSPPPSECESPQWVGDDFCDDENNKEGCEWDGGDCCNNDSDDWDMYCDDCLCLDPTAGGSTTTTTTTTTTPASCEDIWKAKKCKKMEKKGRCKKPKVETNCKKTCGACQTPR